MKSNKFKTSKAHRDKVNAWRAANKKAIAAALKEGISLTKWREKHGVKVKPAAKPARRKAAKAPAPASQVAA